MNLAKRSCIREGFLALDLQVRRHQPSTQEQRLGCRLARGTDVDVSVEVAIGTLVACDSVDKALTCHSAVDAFVLAVKKTASSITNVL